MGRLCRRAGRASSTSNHSGRPAPARRWSPAAHRIRLWQMRLCTRRSLLAERVATFLGLSAALFSNHRAEGYTIQRLRRLRCTCTKLKAQVHRQFTREHRRAGRLIFVPANCPKVTMCDVVQFASPIDLARLSAFSVFVKLKPVFSQKLPRNLLGTHPTSGSTDGSGCSCNVFAA